VHSLDIQALSQSASERGLSWAHFRSLVERLTDGITVQAPDGALVYANELGARLSGYSSPAELLAAPVGDYARNFDVMDQSGAPMRLEDLPGRRAIRDGEAHGILQVLERATGRRRWRDVKSFAMRDDGGRVEFVVNVIRDVTGSFESLRAAEARETIEARARDRAEFLSRVTALLNESLDCERTLHYLAAMLVPKLADVCTIDLLDRRSGALRRVAVAHEHPAAVRWLLDARFPLDAAMPNDMPDVLRTTEPTVRTVQWHDGRAGHQAVCADGFELCRRLDGASAMFVPIRTAGRTVGVLTLVAPVSARFSDDDLAFATDIARGAGAAVERAELYADATERAQWLSRLQQLTVGLSRSATVADAIDTSTNLARQVFEADAVGLWRLSGDRRYLELCGTYGGTDASRRAAQLLPVEAELPPNAVLAFGEPLMLETPDAICERFPEMRDMVRELRIGAIANAPVKVAGDIIGVLAFRYNSPRTFNADYVTAFSTFSKELGQALDRTRIHAELTDAKRSADEARKAAEAANGAKSAFLATMSHELRTPINAILGFTDLLQLGIGEDQQPARADYVNRIRKNTEHLLELINDILDLSKVEAGQLVIDSAESVAVDVIDEALAVVRHQANARGVELSAQCAPDTRYVGDPLRVRQVLLNLLSNGIKFTPAGGRVTLACATNGATTAFSVIDTGIGIDAKDLERIFEPFVQTAYVYTRESGGTGLGLAISRRLAQLMGGRLSVESAVGQGATFTLTLPARERRRRRR